MAILTKSQLSHKSYEQPAFVKHTSKEDKLLIRNGRSYTLTETCFVPGKIAALLAGSKFDECVDGWFQVTNEVGVILGFRVGPKIIDKMFTD